SSASTHRPSWVTPTGTTSYRAGSSACRTFTAVVHDTSCSADRPPNRTTSRILGSEVTSGPPHEQGPDAEPHHEQATEPVEQIDAVPQLRSVGVDDAHGDDRHEAVEHVELGRLDVLAGHQPDAQGHLHEHGQLGEGREPPEGPSAEPGPVVGGQGPCPGHAVADDHEPGPP